MRKKTFFILLLAALAICVMPKVVAAENESLSQVKVIAIATEAVKAKGVSLEAVSIIYDDGNKLWSEKIGALTSPSSNPNYGVLVKGFLKNYRTVYFDFKEPLPDIWVFVDKDTGEILEVYKE